MCMNTGIKYRSYTSKLCTLPNTITKLTKTIWRIEENKLLNGVQIARQFLACESLQFFLLFVVVRFKVFFIIIVIIVDRVD